jgi:pimeloyl-ACP methyl ester carboxylesterase
MDCASGASTARRALIEREARSTLLGNTIDFPLPDICDAVGCPDLGDGFREPPSSNLPVLFVTGTVDCRTPAENVADLAPGLPNHEHLVVEDAGHGDLLLATGVQNAIRRFVQSEPLEERRIQADAPLVFEKL